MTAGHAETKDSFLNEQTYNSVTRCFENFKSSRADCFKEIKGLETCRFEGFNGDLPVYFP